LLKIFKKSNYLTNSCVIVCTGTAANCDRIFFTAKGLRTLAVAVSRFRLIPLLRLPVPGGRNRGDAGSIGAMR